MKQKLIAVALLIVATVIIFLISFKFSQSGTFKFPQSGKVNAQKIFTAAQTYTRDLKRQGIKIPDLVNLKELIARGLLQPSDVAGFAGAEVTVSLIANPNEPNTVLMRALFPDGQEMLTMGDGSVQLKQQKP